MSSLWIVPIAAVVLEQIFAVLVSRVDARLGWTWAGHAWGAEGARALAGAVVTLTLSFTVFTFGSLLVAIQVASGQYTPRIIATTLLRNNVIRYTVGIFVFTFIFSIGVLARIETTVPQLAVHITGVLGFICLASFLYLIDYAARLLRPVTLVYRVAEEGLCVLDSVYPEKSSEGQEPVCPNNDLATVRRAVLQRGLSGVVVAINVKRLISEANKSNCVFEFVPQVGDFIGSGEPLFLVHGDSNNIDENALVNCVTLGSERTLEQDPLFAFRILVDIAIKALSAAINDPTTAVLAIDQLHRLLRRAGRRNLRADFINDSAGELRVILRTPNWSDFVHLAFTEIRFYGASNIQIARRLRAMITNLASTLAEARVPALQEQLRLLDRMLEKVCVLPEDLALARISDTQGLGGSTGPSSTMVVEPN